MMAVTAPTAVCAPAPARNEAQDDDAKDGASFADLLGRSREAAKAPAAEGTSKDKAADADKAKADDTATTATPADPALPPWLAALHTPAPPRADMSAAGGATDDATALDASAAALPAAAAPAKPALPATVAPGGPARDAKAEAAPATFQQALAAASEREADTDKASAIEPAHASVQGLDATTLPAQATTAPAAAPRLAEPVAAPQPTATLAAPVDSPDFAAALGVQVSVFARDGVHEAQLQLNPADMGPVSVQIALDGTQARVHFGAEVAATRQAIESSLPELAAALRDAGFTLSGGGVSQQRGGREGEAGGDASGPRRNRVLAGGTGENGVTVRAAPRRVTLGGLDLYA